MLLVVYTYHSLLYAHVHLTRTFCCFITITITVTVIAYALCEEAEQSCTKVAIKKREP